MNARLLRYRFPSDHASSTARSPADSARGLAAAFLEVPQRDLTPARLDGVACYWAYLNGDPGSLEMASGDPIGDELASWLRMVIGPAERFAYLDVDVEGMGRVQAEAMRLHLQEINR